MRTTAGIPVNRTERMTTIPFAVADALRFGWKTTRANLRILLPAQLIVAFFYFLPNIAESIIGNDPAAVTLSSAVFNIVTWIIQTILGMGFTKMCLRLHDGETTGYSDLIACTHLFFKYFVASVLYGAICLAGFILLIVPGFIWGIQFWFFTYIIVDREMGPIKALKESSRLTRGVKKELFYFSLALLAVNILGILALFAGLLFAIPTSIIATTYVYRRLTSDRNGYPLPTTGSEPVPAE